MFIPFKLISNNSYIRKIKTFFSPDPSIIFDSSKYRQSDLLNAISIIKFDNSFKTTYKNRHILTQNYLSKYFIDRKINIIDIGASYGSTSVELIKKLNFHKYYVVDKNNCINIYKKKNNYYYFNDNGKLILFSNKFFLVYTDEIIKKFSFFNFLFSNNNFYFKKSKNINLTHPDLLNKKKIDVIKQDIYDDWNFEKGDLIILGNILNLSYFDKYQIINIFNKILKLCNDQCIIAIIDNRKYEKSSIFRLSTKKLFIEKIINGGSDIHTLINNNFIKK